MKNYVKKIGVALILLLFVLSIVPVALAESDSSNGKDAMKDVIKARLLGQANKIRANIKEVDFQGVRDKIQEHLNDSNASKKILQRSETLKDLAEKKLLEARDRLQQSRENYVKIKDRYNQAVEDHNKQLARIRTLDAEARRCNDDSEECQAKKTELKLGVTNHLEKTIDVVERALDKLKDRINNIDDLSQEEKDNALSLVSTMDDRLNVVKDKVDGFDENTSKEDIQSAITDLKSIAQDARKLQRRIVTLLIDAKLNTLVQKHDEFRNGMELRIKTLQDKGIDTSDLEDILKEFDQKVEKLKEDYQTAQQKWENANNDRFDVFEKELRTRSGAICRTPKRA